MTETRHTEKMLLFNLLRTPDPDKHLVPVINSLIASMEQEDVELVRKKVSDTEKGII